MPTYEYECKGCKHHFEELQSFSEAVLKTCPKCKKKKLQRLLGAGAAIIFKGAGFYQTDYRSESYKSAAKADAPAPAASAEKTSTTDTKSAPAKTETKSDGKKSKS